MSFRNSEARKDATNIKSEMDSISERLAAHQAERAASLVNIKPQVKIVLVVLSSKRLVLDLDSLQHKIIRSYPQAAVFFMTPSGHSLGPAAPELVDLLIDLTGPNERSPWFQARKLRKMSRLAYGRRTGWFRTHRYDGTVEETWNETKSFSCANPTGELTNEILTQKAVMSMAGISWIR